MTPFAETTSHAVPSCTFRVWMAGDYDSARAFARKWASERGACWSLSRVDYVYTGGEQAGFCATLIHYARFPSSREELARHAAEFGLAAMEYLGQASFSVEGPEFTTWVTRRK